jgi:predicted MPP superfamily phosphohydrolase
MADFHTGSHVDDVSRLGSIVDEANRMSPDIALFGGDYVNMQWFGGGRIPPRIIAATLARIQAPLGRFAVLGNHDYTYDDLAVQDALDQAGITVLNHDRSTVRLADRTITVAGIPNARVPYPQAYALLASIRLDEPTIVLAHDPFWFAHLPAGPHLMLAGHTHGGQVRLPGIGVFRNASKAPLRWSYGLVHERGQYLYVTSGIGTSGAPIRWRVPPEFVVLDVIGKPARIDAHSHSSRQPGQALDDAGLVTASRLLTTID